LPGFIEKEKELPAPSYTVVLDIFHQLDRRLKVLAHEGDAAYEQEFDPLLRREADHPNDMWQCDHKELKIWAVDPITGRTGKVWITAIIDDFSRVVPGYLLGVGKPNSMRIAAALQQGIWTKEDKEWPVCGIPDIFYSDQGPDFLSTHIEQVAGDLHMQLVNTIVYKPRGRGKIERLFRTIIQMFCPSYKKSAQNNPVQMDDLDAAFQKWLRKYHNRKHSEINMTPLQKWLRNSFLPRLPDSIEALNLILMKAKQSKMFRDGIHFSKQRYSHDLLSESVGQQFEVRYDPRDRSRIWVFGSGGKFICQATAQGIHPNEKDIETVMSNRQRVKKRLKLDVKDRQFAGEKFLDENSAKQDTSTKKQAPKKTVRLRKHFHERP
jgi:putative transposase